METSGSEAANGFENAKEKPKAWIRGSVGLLLAELEGAVPSRVASYANRKTTEGKDRLRLALGPGDTACLRAPMVWSRRGAGSQSRRRVRERCGGSQEGGPESFKLQASWSRLLRLFLLLSTAIVYWLPTAMSAPPRTPARRLVPSSSSRPTTPSAIPTSPARVRTRVKSEASASPQGTLRILHTLSAPG